MELLPCGSQCHRKAAYIGGRKMELLPCGSQCHRKAAYIGGFLVVGVARFAADARLVSKAAQRVSGAPAQRNDTESIEPLDFTKAAYIGGFLVVGVARFELAALRSRTVRATKLRYTPLIVVHLFCTSLYQECVLMFGSASRAHRRFCVTRPEKEVCHPSPTECRCVALSFRNPNCATPR